MLLDLNPDVDAVGDRRRIDVEDGGDAGAVQDVQGGGGALHPRKESGSAPSA